MSSSQTCKECGCAELDYDPARGNTVCTNCGCVMDEQNIISEVQFADNSRGGTSVVGQFVSSEGAHKMPQFGSGFGQCMSKKSREITLYNAKLKIAALGSQLHLNQHCLDMAHNFYKMALINGITRGRKGPLVIAACVYMVCRTEGTSHMLIDISDILQVSVFRLGHVYMQLSTSLCINPPALDPCVYVQRYAHKLEFGDLTHTVSSTAMRLLSRMKRDWMSMGRRPSGLCGAALLVSARIHNFSRTMKDIIKVVRIGENTIKKRLVEFEETASSSLTIDEFHSVDLEAESNPPCFEKSRIRTVEAGFELGTENFKKVHLEIDQLQGEIETLLDAADEKRDKKTNESDMESNAGSIVNKEDSSLENKGKVGHLMISDTDAIDCITNALEIDGNNIESMKLMEVNDFNGLIMEGVKNERKHNTLTDYLSALSARPTAASLGLTDTIAECLDTKKHIVESESDGELDLEGIDDNEIDYMILKPAEVANKTKLWMMSNIDYLREQKVKKIEEERLYEEEMAKDPSQRKKKKIIRKKIKGEHPTAGAAIEKMLAEKKISSKINYEVLRGLTDTKPTSNDLCPPDNDAAASVSLVKQEQRHMNTVKLEGAGDGEDKRPLVVDDSHLKASMSNNKKRRGKLEFKPKVLEKKVKAEISIVENGPIEYMPEVDIEEEDEEEEDDKHNIALSMMRNNDTQGEEFSYDEYGY